MQQYSVQEIRSAYAQKKNWEKQFPLNYFLIRPVSFYITYFTLKVTLDPAKVAIFGFVLGVIGCFLLMFSSICSIWPGFFLIFLFSLFDAVDGNVARTIDGGKTWSLATPRGRIPHKSCVRSLSGTSWMATGRTGVAVSHDDGITWDHVSSQSYYTFDVDVKTQSGWLAGSDGRVARFVVPKE